MLLQDKVAIVTGGSRGIGFAIVKEYLKNGAIVVLCGSRRETAEKAVQELKAENAQWRVEGIWPDLTDYDSVKAAFDKVAEKYGRIDILANNAGVSASEPISAYTPEMFQKNHGSECKGRVQTAPRGGGPNDRTGQRLHHQYQQHGKSLRSARRGGLSHQQVCRKRHDSFPGP